MQQTNISGATPWIREHHAKSYPSIVRVYDNLVGYTLLWTPAELTERSTDRLVSERYMATAILLRVE